jgi:hypothetical protein
MNQNLITGIVGAGSAILGALSQATVSYVINNGSCLRKERIRVMIDIEEYLDELWDLSNTLYNLKDNNIASLDDGETKEISASYNRHIDRFYAIWDSRKRIIELNLYFKDEDSRRAYRKIERLYEKSKNKIELLSPDPMIDNNKLLGDLLGLENEIYNLRLELSKRLMLHLSWRYILLPTYMRLGRNLSKWLNKPFRPSDDSDETTSTADDGISPRDVKHGRKQNKQKQSTA